MFLSHFTMTSRLTTRQLAQLAAPLLSGDLFDLLPDTVFFLKDRAGHYIAVNQTLVERCGRRSKTELLGRTVADVFPAGMAESYAEQDRQVLVLGQPILNQLELHLYPNHQPGWCLTAKLPLRDDAGCVVGLAGLSRDVRAPAATDPIPPALVAAVDHLRVHYADPMSPARLAAIAGLTPPQFTRQVKRLMQLTPAQLILQTRIQAAAVLLRDSPTPVAAIAVACGFYDHSAFARYFKTATGLRPLAYRRAFGSGRSA
jgi:AraC-like DNA-binding protein